MNRFKLCCFVFLVSIVFVLGCRKNDDAEPMTTTFGKINDTIPDYILYLSNRKGGPINRALKELYFVNADNNEELELTNTADYENVVKFQYHKDSKKIIFTSVIRYGQDIAGLDIFVMDINTKNIINLTNTIERINNGIYEISNVPIHSDPDISKDGNKIVYTKMYNNRWDIVALQLDNQEENTILSTIYPNNSWKPRWSVDATKIVYLSNVNNKWQVFLMNSDGTSQKQISNQAYAEAAIWSPNGENILFLSGSSDPFLLDVFTANANGNDLKKITSGGKSSNHGWSNSSNYISYKYGPIDSGKGDIYIIKSDGTLNHNITSLNLDFVSISWSPNDDKLLFEFPTESIPEIYMATKDGAIIQQITNAGYSSRPQWIDVNLIE